MSISKHGNWKYATGKGGKQLQNENIEIKELHGSLEELDNRVVNIHNQVEMKEKAIEFLQL